MSRSARARVQKPHEYVNISARADNVGADGTNRNETFVEKEQKKRNKSFVEKLLGLDRSGRK